MMMVTSQGLFPTGKNSPSLTQQRDNGYSSTHRKQPAIISWLRSDDLAIFRLQSNWLVEKTFKGKNTLPAPMQPPTKADTKQKEKTGPGSANLPTKGWMRTTLKSHVLDWRLSLTYWSKNRKYINIRITRGAPPTRLTSRNKSSAQSVGVSVATSCDYQRMLPMYAHDSVKATSHLFLQTQLWKWAFMIFMSFIHQQTSWDSENHWLVVYLPPLKNLNQLGIFLPMHGKKTCSKPPIRKSPCHHAFQNLGK